ncbi:MAG: type II toxin-antitoxin system RelE/ParE family toxin [Candidatus Binatia bacterium]
MKVRWSEPALAHLDAIHDYIAQQASPYVAERFLKRLVATVDPLEPFPQLGRRVPEAEGHYRELVCRQYRLVYRAGADDILVVAVIHGRREFALALTEALDDLDNVQDHDQLEPG